MVTRLKTFESAKNHPPIMCSSCWNWWHGQQNQQLHVLFNEMNNDQIFDSWNWTMITCSMQLHIDKAQQTVVETDSDRRFDPIKSKQNKTQ